VFPAAGSAGADVPFDADAFLWTGTLGETYESGDVMFSQGAPSGCILYLQQGAIKLSVLSPSGWEGVVAILKPGDFFGESALTGQPRFETATAMTASRVLIIPKASMIRLLRTDRAFADYFIAHTLARKIRAEEDLVDQLCNSCERRLARMLLRLARCGEPGGPRRVPSTISQSTLASLIGTTRPHVNLLLRKFRERGFIESRDGGPLEINESLAGVIENDEPRGARRAARRSTASGTPVSAL